MSSGFEIPQFYSMGSFGNFGTQTYIDQNLPSINFNGTLEVRSSVVSGETRVNGTLSIKETRLNILAVNGQVTTNDSVIEGACTIQGMLKSIKTKFLGSLTITSKDTTLIASETKDILIKSSSGSLSEKVTISDGTSVNGSITFESGRGEVFVGPDCTISGEIIGGVLR